MNNEPVGHLYPEGEGVTVYDIKFAWKVTGTTEPIPLYTHPAKTLTLSDSEMDDVIKESEWASGYLYPKELIKRALKKAGEK